MSDSRREASDRLQLGRLHQLELGRLRPLVGFAERHERAFQHPLPVAELLAALRGLLQRQLGGGDVPHDDQGARDPPVPVPDRHDRQGHLDVDSVAPDADGLELVDHASPRHARVDLGQLVEPFRRHQRRQRLPDDLVRPVAIDLLRGPIPGQDRSIERDDQDSIVGDLQNCFEA